MSIEVGIHCQGGGINNNDFEMVDNPDTELSNGIRRLFDEIDEKDNRTSEFKRKYRVWRRFAIDVCNECAESVFRCYQFGSNEFSHFTDEFKEKYSEQVNELEVSEPDIEMGFNREDDM